MEILFVLSTYRNGIQIVSFTILEYLQTLTQKLYKLS